jgi:hypothetical protein
VSLIVLEKPYELQLRPADRVTITRCRWQLATPIVPPSPPIVPEIAPIVPRQAAVVPQFDLFGS